MSVNVGVVGCGNISKFHFAGLEAADATIAWICDVNEAAARPWVEKTGARFTPDYRDIIRDPEVSCLSVLCPSAFHKPVCLDAIDAGKSVICEKTLADNPGDALDMVQAARVKGVPCFMSYMKRFIPAVVKAKELLPRLGRIVSTHICSHQYWGDLWNGNPPSGFFHTPESGVSQVRKNYGGGALICGGSHLLDLVCFFLGRPHRLCARVFSPEGRDYDLHAMAMLETANGLVNLEVCAHAWDRIGFLNDGWDERLEINGVNGRLELYSAEWDAPLQKASLLRHYERQTGVTTEYTFPPVCPFTEAIKSFLRDIAANRQGDQDLTTGYVVDELIAHINQSSTLGQAVDVNWKA